MADNANAADRPTSALRELASELLGEPINGWLIARANDRASTRQIALELAEDTDGKVAVSHATIAVWLTDAGLTDTARRTNQYE